jgi:hypothetical protein
MTSRKHRSEFEWRLLIEQQVSSGLNGIRFCEQEEISCKTFYRHRKALKGKTADSVTSQFIKVQQRPLQPMALQSAAILQYRDSRLQLSVSVDPIWVAELMKALA